MEYFVHKHIIAFTWQLSLYYVLFTVTRVPKHLAGNALLLLHANAMNTQCDP